MTGEKGLNAHLRKDAPDVRSSACHRAFSRRITQFSIILEEEESGCFSKMRLWEAMPITMAASALDALGSCFSSCLETDF